MTVTFVSVTSPVLVTVIVNVAVPPVWNVWLSGVFSILIPGAMMSTSAVSVSVMSGPTGGVPVAVALFVKSAVTFASVHS